MLVLLLPISVSAGLIGALSGSISLTINGMFGPLHAAESVKTSSLESMALLSAASLPSKISTEIKIEDNALLAEEKGVSSKKNIIERKPENDQISTYVVHKGDTLSQIAEMFGVTVNTIKWSNDLSSNTLREGEVLVILPISGISYTVKNGDTLSSIAKEYKADIEDIKNYNLIESGSLAVGTTIIIPDGEASPSVSQTSAGVYVEASIESNSYYMRPVAVGKRTQGIHGYNGVDLAAALNTPIFAAASGEVIVSRSGSWNGGYGNYIVIKHDNGTQTLYAHNNQNKVSVGDKVQKGDVIALMGSTGKATGIHLHFEIRGAKNPF